MVNSEQRIVAKSEFNKILRTGTVGLCEANGYQLDLKCGKWHLSVIVNKMIFIYRTSIDQAIKTAFLRRCAV